MNLRQQIALGSSALAVALVLTASCSPSSDAPTVAQPPSAQLLSVQPERLISSDADSMITPAGWKPKACVTEIPNGAKVSRAGLVTRKDGSNFQIVKCIWNGRRSPNPRASSTHGAGLVFPIDSGWVEWAANYTTGSPFQTLLSGWHVPAAPTGSYTGTQVYFAFSGFQRDSFIIQPVLQYGYNGVWGGSYWTAAAWRCDLGPNCTHGNWITANPGDSLTTVIAASGCASNSCTWAIGLGNWNQSTSASHQFTDNDLYLWASGGVVEVYGLTSCSQFPAEGIWFSGVAASDHNGAQTLTPTNYISPGLSPSCQFNVSSTASTVRLYHNYSSLSSSITGDTATSIYTAHRSGGVTPYASSYHWEWCASACGGALRAARLQGSGGIILPESFEAGWHDVGYTTQSICWVMSKSLLRVTVTDHFGQQSVAQYSVPYLVHTCS